MSLEISPKQNKNRIMSTLGRTPTEIALSVINLVTEAAGKEPNDKGLSTLDKLIHSRVDPAVEMLTKTNWRSFFEKYYTQKKHSGGASDSEMSGNESDQARKRRLERQHKYNQGVKVNHSLEQSQQLFMNSLESASAKMVKRMELLWDELKIPMADRKFYKNSLIGDQATTLQRCQELSRYIAALRRHRKRTIRALYSASVREVALKRCIDAVETHVVGPLLEWQRAAADRSGGMGALGGMPEVPVMLPDSPARRELVVALRDLQEATYDALCAIQYWREQLWRPQPFVYQGSNYMQKMQQDMRYFDDKVHLGWVDLSWFGRERGGWSLLLTGHGCTPTQKDSNGEQEHERVMSSEGANPEGGDSAPADEGMFRPPFTSPWELSAKARYLAEEELLQRSLALEARYLVKNKVFIPLVRYGPQGGTKSNESSTILDAGGSLAGPSVTMSTELKQSMQRQKQAGRSQKAASASGTKQQHRWPPFKVARSTGFKAEPPRSRSPSPSRSRSRSASRERSGQAPTHAQQPQAATPHRLSGTSTDPNAGHVRYEDEGGRSTPNVIIVGGPAEAYEEHGHGHGMDALDTSGNYGTDFEDGGGSASDIFDKMSLVDRLRQEISETNN